MGLFFAETGTPAQATSREVELLHQLECRACPLNKNPRGKIQPTGSDHPVVYILGEAPGEDEEIKQQQFVGQAGTLLRSHLPKKHLDKIRWNNVIRTRPTKPGVSKATNRTPVFEEIEACRPSIIRDIEATKPKAIFGFGNVPLQWVSGFSNVTVWRGRRMPVKIGNHACWYYPMLHPSFLLRARRKDDKTVTGQRFVGSEDERMFLFDLDRAFAELLGSNPIPDADPHSTDRALENVEVLMEFGSAGLRQIEEALASLVDEPVVGVDYETNTQRPYRLWPDSRILTIGVGSLGKSYAFALDHSMARWSDDERKKLIGIWTEFLRTTKAVKAVHNLAFDLEWTVVQFGIDLLRAGRWEDTQSQAAILDERRGKVKPGCFSLEFLIQNHFGFNLKKISNIDRRKLDTTDLSKVLRYNALDGKYHAYLWDEQNYLLQEQGLTYPYGLALRRVPAVVAAQVRGVPVDQDEVSRLQTRYAKRIKDVESEILQLEEFQLFQRKVGRPLNPQSNPDLVQLFHKVLHYEECVTVDKYTKKPKLSVDEGVLQKIAKNHGSVLADALLRLRKANKRKSTYIDPLSTDSDIMWPDGMIHTIFNTTFAETGRLSSEDPNLQNFPKRDEEAREVRRPIVAPPGHVILAFDYGQIEARVIAMFTKDKVFCKALWENYDVHMEWAQRLAAEYPRRVGGKQNLKDKKAMKAFRTDIKNQWTFPLFFGASLRSASNYLSIPEDVLGPLYEEFWDQFSGVKAWQEEQLQFYREHGYVSCLTGRRRRGPMSTNKVFNSPVQGTAAEIVMDAMCRLSETGDPELQPEINIHDDLTYVRVPEKRVEVVAEKILPMMLNVPFPWVNVPITVEVSSGANWMEMEEIATFSSEDWK